jgi:serine/threonine-protein kinase
MVLAAVGLGYYFFFMRAQPPDEPFVLPPNAPVPGNVDSRNGTPGTDQVLAQGVSEKNAAESEKAEQEGDNLHRSGNLQGAATSYRKAFQANPRPVLALKLFSVFRILNPTEASDWYQRYVQLVPATQVRGLFAGEVQGLASSSAH